jgi:hypothetical protein
VCTDGSKNAFVKNMFLLQYCLSVCNVISYFGTQQHADIQGNISWAYKETPLIPLSWEYKGTPLIPKFVVVTFQNCCYNMLTTGILRTCFHLYS